MQGIHEFIPTKDKITYINSLLDVGFDIIDFGSFVSPKAIPQMKDTAEVISNLNIGSKSELLAIVANVRGADDALKYPEIKYLGYPFSISETFQLRNTNATIEESLIRLSDIQAKCLRNGKELVIYVSMGFGNPYGDPWNVDICQKWVNQLAAMNIKHIALSDTIGVATPESIRHLFTNLIPPYPDVEFGAHLHTRPDEWFERIEAAYSSGCRRFDGAIKGYGGCPMAMDDLTGNMPTERLIEFFDKTDETLTNIDREAFQISLQLAQNIFPY